MNAKSLTKKYMVLVALLGVVCVAYSIYNLPFLKIDLYLLILVVLTVSIGSQISIPIPRFKSHISVSDSFIFLALLLYGGEVAVILAAIDAVFASWRFCKQKITVFLNFGVLAVSTAIVSLTLHFAGLLEEVALHASQRNWDNFLIALSVMAIVQFIANTAIATVYGSMSTEQTLWDTWKTKYLWSFVTYVVGAASAGFLFTMVHVVGFGVVIAAFPVIYLMYLSYKMYLRNVEMSIAQAEQAEKYAHILEERSEALRNSEERFRSAFDFAPIGIGLVSRSGRWLKVNRALCDILGYTEDEFLETDFQSMLVPEDLGETLVRIHELLSGKIQTCQLEQRYLNKEGKTVWASWSVSPINTGESPSLIFQIQDITDKKIAEEKLQYEATHDSLTGLPNRALFMSRLEKALARAHDNPTYKTSVLFIDLDRFKIVNDSLGHIVGDQLLVRIAGRLKECLRPSDIVARLGGDEFTILVEGKYDQQEIIRIAERVQEKFAHHFDLNGQEVYSSASIGVLQSTDQHLTAEDMMRDADTAMYQAKRAGKARHEVFDPNMHELVKQTLQLETDLRRAIEHDEFKVYYQPIYSLATNQITGFEALARWHHSSMGNIPPDRFIPLAEEIGLIDTLGEQILRKACLQINSIQNNLGDERQVVLSVNLSCKQFAHPQLVKRIRKILKETGFTPANLKLEITESVFFEHKERAIRMLKELREHDIEINIDDFGTGYSNLSYLTQLPISTLKIDRTFIDSIENEGNNSEIVQTIIALARSLGMKVIAEGVESKNQLDKLRLLNCEGAQGYYFAKPMPFDEVERFVNEEPDLVPPTYDGVPIVPAIQ
ncbi:MAG: EAL domain-containing protein [Acidobacteriota bacterium]|nr:EAL domain-containing protein [Acidobacteriota bacterium]